MSPHLALGHAEIIGAALALSLCAACDSTGGLAQGTIAYALTPERVDFGPTFIGAEAIRTVAIENTGEVPFWIEGATVPEGPVIAELTRAQVYPGRSAVMTLRFSPTAIDLHSSSVDVAIETAVAVLEVSGSGRTPPGCDDGNACTDDRFDLALAACANDPRQGSCDDGNACTERDRCDGATCVGESIQCSDGIECTRDLCDPNTGCVREPDDTRCPDTDPCTLDRCGAAGCEHPFAPDGETCGEGVTCVTAQVCIDRACVERPVPEGARCDDGNVCTLGDHCEQQACEGIPVWIPPLLLAETNVLEEARGIWPVADLVYAEDQRPGRIGIIERDGGRAAVTKIIQWQGATEDLVDSGDGLLLRSSQSGQQMLIEVFDIADPKTPVLLSSFELTAGGSRGWLYEMTVENRRMYACTFEGMVMVDVSDPLAPAPPVPVATEACEGIHPASLGQPAVRGSTWVWQGFGATTSGYGLIVARAEAGQLTTLISLPIEQFLIHTIATDEHLVVASLQSEGLIVIDLDQSPPTVAMIEPTFAPGWLRAVEGKIAVVRGVSGLNAFDLSTPTNPIALPGAIDDQYFGPVAAFGGRVYAQSERGPLEVAELDSTGIHDVVQVAGQGAHDRLYQSDAGLVSASMQSVTMIDRQSWELPSIATTPISQFGPTFPSAKWIEDGSGPVGVYSPRRDNLDYCGAAGFFCGWPGEIYADGTDGQRVSIASDGAATYASSTPIDPLRPRGVVSVRGCVGGAVLFDASTSQGHYAVIDRCTGIAEGVEVASLPLQGFANESQILVVAHEGGFTTIGRRPETVLLDHRQPLAPVIFASRPSTLADRTYGAAFDGRHWLLLNDGSPPHLEVYDVTTSTTTPVKTIVFDPTIGIPARGVIHLDWPLAYLGAALGDAPYAMVYDLETTGPAFKARVPLATLATDVLAHDGELYFARTDGISVIHPACPP